VVITGGASGIGQATAEAFVAAGAHVVLLDRDAPRLTATAATLGAATAIYGDVSYWEDCQAAARAAQATGRPVRVLVNCSAAAGRRPRRGHQPRVDLRLHHSAEPLGLQRNQRRSAGP
jgi:NAD(P)-dependent dehydrogenase (short-subunit alcohol dehydrogenase family)